MSKKKGHSKVSRIFWRIAISTVGVALIVIAVVELLLFFFGEATAANVSTRRVGGADDGRPVSQRYEWSLDYTFYDKNGITHSGNITLRGNDISVKSDSWVYYFPFVPFVNALESEAEPNLSQLLFIVIGTFLLFVMNRHEKKRKSDKTISDSSTHDYDDSIEAGFYENE